MIIFFNFIPPQGISKKHGRRSLKKKQQSFQGSKRSRHTITPLSDEAQTATTSFLAATPPRVYFNQSVQKLPVIEAPVTTFMCFSPDPPEELSDME